jgi:O-antigen/teichoic acid export membrane protein
VISVAEERASISPTISRNIVANFIGTLWTGAMGPLLVSVYVHFLGIEAYGLVGILTTLQLLFTLLDLGLSTTINREMARLSVRQQGPEMARDLVRTAEILYWSSAVVIGAVTLLLSPLIAHDWLRPQALSPAAIQQAFFVMGLILAFQFPFALYSGGLMGLQRQVLLNVIIVGATTVRGLGSILVLWLVAPTIQTFFLWQFVSYVLQTLVTAFVLWRSLPSGTTRPRFRWSLLLTIWRFAAGMFGISFFALLLTQTDKIILSRLLPLEKFGYYTLATTVASALLVVVTPIFAAVFPRFSQLVLSQGSTLLRSLYHYSCQLVTVTMLPLTVTIVLFSTEILRVWTRNPAVVEHAHLLVSLLAIGTALNGFMSVPFALQLATGWTKLSFYQNMIGVAVLIPLLFWMANRYGAIGAAVIWILINAGYVFIGIQIMHTRLLKGEKRTWYVRDIGVPLAGIVSVALVERFLFPTGQSWPVTVAGLMVVLFSAAIAACLLTPITQEWIQRRFLHRIRGGHTVG